MVYSYLATKIDFSLLLTCLNTQARCNPYRYTVTCWGPSLQYTVSHDDFGTPQTSFRGFSPLHIVFSWVFSQCRGSAAIGENDVAALAASTKSRSVQFLWPGHDFNLWNGHVFTIPKWKPAELLSGSRSVLFCFLYICTMVASIGRWTTFSLGEFEWFYQTSI